MNERERARRQRDLSEEERALWRDVARSVKPLRRQTARGAKDNEIVEAATQPAPTSKRKAAKPASAPARPAKPASPPLTPLAPLGRREKQALARGNTRIDRRIDLHGLTQSEAHVALAHFLRRAQRDGAKFALVITGKSGVLRRQVPHWLRLPEFRDALVGFEEAHTAHGGEGALYVRLRRAKD